MFQNLKAGDRIRFRVPAGIGRNGQEWVERKGMVAKYLVFEDHVVVALGMSKRPVVVDARNYVGRA